MNLDSMKDILSAARQEGKAFWEIVLETDMQNRGVSRMESLGKMAEAWHAMREASQVYTGERRSVSGLVGGQGKLMREYASQDTLGGEFIAQVIAEALSTGESNDFKRGGIVSGWDGILTGSGVDFLVYGLKNLIQKGIIQVAQGHQRVRGRTSLRRERRRGKQAAQGQQSQQPQKPSVFLFLHMYLRLSQELWSWVKNRQLS